MKSYLESFDKLEYIRLYVDLKMSYREVAKKMGLSSGQYNIYNIYNKSYKLFKGRF